jgi:hypothetical protein
MTYTYWHWKEIIVESGLKKNFRNLIGDSKTLNIECLNFTQHLEFQYKSMSLISESIDSKSLRELEVD